jgi:hypothetical protein
MVIIKCGFFVKACDCRIKKCLYHFDVLQKTVKNPLKMAHTNAKTHQNCDSEVISLQKSVHSSW